MKLATPREVAERYGMNADRIREMCASREIEAVVTTGPRGRVRYLISDEAFTAWLRKHTVPARKEAA